MPSGRWTGQHFAVTMQDYEIASVWFALAERKCDNLCLTMIAIHKHVTIAYYILKKKDFGKLCFVPTLL